MKTNKVITTLAMMAALGGSSLTTVSAFADTTPDADTNALTTDSSSTTDSSTAASTDSSTKASTTDSSTATTDATTDTSPAADVKETPAADVKTPATPATPATPQELPQAGDNTTAFAMGMATFAALISVAMVSMKKKMGFSK